MTDRIVVIKEPQTLVITTDTETPVVVSSDGAQGPQGEPGLPGAPGGSRFEHIQASPASDWVIVHGLNIYPSVTVIVNDDEVEADVHYNSLNSVTVHFASPQSGRAEII